MSVVSETQVRGNVLISVSGSPEVIPTHERSPGEIPGYEDVPKKHEAVGKRLDPTSENVRNKVWMSPELLVYSNYEYVYSMFPIDLSLFWGEGGE